MNKVIKKGEGVYSPNLEYCESLEKKIVGKSGLCPRLGGDVNWTIPERITAENEQEAGKILDSNIEDMLNGATIPELEARKACMDCEIFDKCWKMQLITMLGDVLQRLK